MIKRHVRGMIYGSGESTPRSVRLRASSASSATVRLRTEGHIEVYWLPSTVRELRELPPEHATEILRATARLSPEPDEQSALEGKLTSDDKTFLWRLVSTSNADDLPDYFVIYKAPHPNLLVVIAVVPLQDASRDTAGTEVTEAFPQEDRIRQVLTEDADEILRRCGEIWEANGMNSSEEVCELLQGPESLRGDDHS
ncbi:hypothetical protein [Streptomyces sp. NPDC005017]|uniref:hypothetical protein n=1 Tax=Streptomyces sp. NPDC005017 TaxID=3364706 RepID=UPI00368445B7